VYLEASTTHMSRLLSPNDYLESLVAPFTDEPFTMFAWIKRVGTSGAQCFINVGERNNASDDNSFKISVNNSDQVFGRTEATSGVNVTAGAIGNDTASWHSVMFRSASSSSRYAALDATISAEQTTTVNVVSANVNCLRIGRNNEAVAAEQFDGKIAHVAIWNVALSDAEYNALQGGDNPLAVQPANLKAYYPFVTDDVTDHSGNGNNLTDSGSSFDADNPTVDAAPSGQTITHSGLGTASVYGTHTLSKVAAQTAAPSGKSSAAAYGSHTIGPASPAQSIAPAGKASSAAFGTHAFAKVAARTLAPGGIGSAAVYGSFTIANNAGVPSAAVYGTHQVADTGIKLIGHTGLASAAAYGSQTVSNTVENISQQSGDSAVAYGSHTLAIETVGIAAPSGISSAAAYGSNVVADVVLAATVPGCSSAARLGRHTFIGGVPKDFVSSVVLSRHRGLR
jgi:hypothetical protein